MSFVTRMAAACAMISSASVAHAAGVTTLPIEMDHHDRPVDIALFYPSMADPTDEPASKMIFDGPAMAVGADIAAGQYPVILFSHGMGGHLWSNAWLAAGLADLGAIVIAVKHPGSSFDTRDPATLMHHWTRAQDMHATLDYILNDTAYSSSMDLERVSVAGFSYGGWTALSLGGVTGNKAGMLETCESGAADDLTCGLIQTDDFSLADTQSADWDANYKMPAIKSVLAIDPGLVWGLDAGDVENVTADIAMIGLGSEEDRMSATNFDDSGLAALLPSAKTYQIVPANHFSAFPECKRIGPIFLAVTFDDPVCTDPEGGNRSEIHRQILDIAADHFGL